jgi:hypothetical protein
MVSEAAARFMVKSRAESTLRGYDPGWMRFSQYCLEHSECALPANPVVVADFVAELADIGLSVPSIEKTLAAVSFEHRKFCVESPTLNAGVRLVLEGREHAKSSRQVKPFTLSLISRAVGQLPSSDSIMVWRTVWRMTVGMFAMLRFSEVTRIQVKDIFFSDDGNMRLYIPRSKTDQRSKGLTKWLPALDKDYCPVALTKAYMKKFGLVNGFLQPKSKGKSFTSSAAIEYGVGRDNLSKVLTMIGEPTGGYAEHSYKRGGALAALEAGLTTREQMLFGNWASERMVHLYSSQSASLHHDLVRRVADMQH